MAGINGITSPNGQGSSGGVTDDLKLTKPLQSARIVSEGANKNFVVPDSAKKKAEALLASLLSTTKPSSTEQAAAAEQGHATGPTPEQQASAAKAEWQAKKTAFDAAVNTNKSADARIAELETQKAHLKVLYDCGQMGDGVLTWKELEFLKEKGTDPEKAAADWMMKNKADFWDSMGKGHTSFDVNGVANLNGEPIGRGLTRQAFQAKVAELDGYIAQARAVKVAVPADPGPAPGGQPGTAGGPKTDGPSNTGGPTKETRAEAEARIFANYNKVGPFSSDAPSPEGRLQDAAGHIQKGLDALQEDLITASTASPPNQGEIMAIQQKMQQVQNAFSAIMQMMKQLQEMQSNMSKMFSEMAMSSIRNMR